MGIELLKPDVNRSYKNFAVDEGNIRYGLHAIKNVGTGIIKEIIAKRKSGPFTSFIGFCERIEPSELNKRDIESLIKAGAFDGFGLYRSQLLAIFDRVVTSIHDNSRKNVKGQVSLFEVNESFVNQNIIDYDIPDIDELRENILLQFEKEVLGIYLSSHPFSKWREKFDDFNIQNIGEFIEKVKGKEEIYDHKTVVLIGMISKVNLKITKNSNEMAFISIEDIYNEQDIIVFPKTYNRVKNVLKLNNPIIVKGRINFDDSDLPKIIAVKIEKIDDALVEQMKQNNKKLYIKINNYNATDISKIKKVLKKYPGSKNVVLYFEDLKKKYTLKSTYMIQYSETLKKEIELVVGPKGVKYC
jgi:DNA polymerase-3 subunit alpha